MAGHARKLKVINLLLDAVDYACQVESFTLNNNTGDAERIFTMCPDGVVFEDADEDYSFEATFLSDWQVAGISTWLWENDGEEVPMSLTLHVDQATSEQPNWTGTVKVKAPNVGGEARATERTEAVFLLSAKPVFTAATAGI